MNLFSKSYLFEKQHTHFSIKTFKIKRKMLLDEKKINFKYCENSSLYICF